MENGVPQLSTKITEMLGIKYPIFQGGMAWVADASIASAVSNAGGLGIIGCGPWDTDTILAQVRACKEKTDKPFGLNIMLMSEYVDDIMQMVLDEDIRVVTTGAGNPGKYIPRLKEKNIKVIPVAGSVAIAKRVAKVGADAVIAEGMESGGHLGEITTMASCRRWSMPSIFRSSQRAESVTDAVSPRHLCWVPKAFRWGRVSLRQRRATHIRHIKMRFSTPEILPRW